MVLMSIGYSVFNSRHDKELMYICCHKRTVDFQLLLNLMHYLTLFVCETNIQ